MSNFPQSRGPKLSALYTIAEAARLCELSKGRVRRWVRGYSFRRGEEVRNSPPVVHAPHQSESNTVGLDFLDLIEIRYVKAFLDEGVTWPVLRSAHDRASAMLQVDHPFATEKFFTDGQTILTQIDEPALLDIMRSQLAFSRILDQYLAGREGLDFDSNEMAIRWWPMGRKQLVVIDAARSFGQPIISTEGVPTAVLKRAYLVESVHDGGHGEDEHLRRKPEVWTPDGPKESPVPVVLLGQLKFEKSAIERVASWYNVEKRSVRVAVEYESSFLAAA
jgi:Putative DNA-binding HTH domain